jgi:hypothetical protein
VPASQSDVLAAASLILAILGVVYALWYAEIREAIELQPKPVRVKTDYKTARSVLWTRAVPLAAATTADLVVFLPAVIGPDRDWIHELLSKPAAAFAHYDPVPVALNLATLFTLALVIEVCRQTIGLWRHCRRDLATDND